MRKLLIWFAALLPGWLVLCPQTACAGNSEDVRVGVVAFEDFDREYRKWETVLSEFSRESKGELGFKLAVGTYGDLLHWMEKGWIDVGILTAGVFAESLRRSEPPGGIDGYEYVATVGLPPAVTPWSAADRRASGYHYRYRSTCVVRNDSSIRSIDDIGKRAAAGEIEFVFVHPYSVSGRILPSFCLRKLGVTLSEKSVHYSHSHSGSLRRLTGAADGRERVAFVWDDALRDRSRDDPEVRAVSFPALDHLTIPHDVVVGRRDWKHFDRLRTLVLAHRDAASHPDFLFLEDWQEQYGKIREWDREVSASSSEAENQRVSLDEIRQILIHSAKACPEPPRIALVLSGGGAKCSYQAGAVSAIEEMLEEIREQHLELDLDLDLIVGTSGGAINTIPIALGLSKDSVGRAKFQQTWQELDQRDILKPSLLMRVNLGVWFALLQIGIVLMILRLFPLTRERRRRLFIQIMLILATGAILLAYFRFSPWELLGRNHFWHHLYLWCTLGIRTSAWMLLAAGLLWFLITRFLYRRSSRVVVRPKPVGWVIGVCLAVLPILQIVTVFWLEKTLSGGQGLEWTLSDKFPRMINGMLERRGEPALDLASAKTNSQALALLGEELFSRELWQRDLVITGNCIAQNRKVLPSDIYFFARGKGSTATAPGFGIRGLDIADSPSHLMDFVLGSGTIFPVFPPRTVRDFPEPGDRIELIDGGFAHNSPIEAAVLWGATHIILLEVTPEKRQLRDNFLQNAATAFVHLHRQTQLVDMRSKQQVMVFSLSPEPPHMCVIDFSSNLIRESIERGYRDAGGGQDGVDREKRFRKELGEPVFTEVSGLAGPRHASDAKSP